jgi:hypothetical protein
MGAAPMIDKNADIFEGKIPEFIQDMIWDDEHGFFENSLGLGAIGIGFVSGPLAILNVVAGILGIGVNDFGRRIDQALAGKPIDSIDPKGEAQRIVDKYFPEIEAKSHIRLLERVIIAAKPAPADIDFGDAPAPKKPSAIKFEAGQPSSVVKKPAIRFDAGQPQREAPAPPTKNDGLKSKEPSSARKPGSFDEAMARARANVGDSAIADDSGAKAKKPKSQKIEEQENKAAKNIEVLREKSRLDAERRQSDFSHAAELKKLDADADAKSHAMKLDYEEAHRKAKTAEYDSDRRAMEHQLSVKSKIEMQMLRDKQILEFNKQLLLGEITPEQHSLLSSSIKNEPISKKDLDVLKKTLSQKEQAALKRRLQEGRKINDEALRNIKLRGSLEARNARLLASAKSGNPGILSLFKGKIGKAGLVAAIAMIIFAGLKMIGDKSKDRTAIVPTQRTEQVSRRPSTDLESDLGLTSGDIPSGAKQGPSRSLQRSDSAGHKVNKKLKSIFGE